MSRRRQKHMREIKAAAADFEPIIGTSAEVVFAAAAEGEPTDGPKKFSVQVYNGGALQVNRWDYPVVIDLSGMKARKNVIANLDHDREKRVGHVTGVTNDGSKVVLEGLASASTPYRDEVVESAAAGFPWEASIESMPTQESDFIGDKQKVTVNGREFTGPLYVARKSELYGFAFLSRGADGNTKVKIAASAASSTPKEKSMTPELKKWIEAQGFDAESLSDAQVQTFERLHAVEAAAANEPPKKPEEPAKVASAPTEINAGNDGAGIMGEEDKWSLADVLAAHSDLTDNIDTIIASHEDDVPEKAKLAAIRAKAKERVVGMKKKAIAEKWDSARYELESIKATSEIKLELVRAERPAGPAIHASHQDVSGEILACAIELTGKRDEKKVLDTYGEKTVEAASKQFRHGVSLQELIIEAARANGYQGSTFKKDPAACWLYATRPIMAGGFSTVDLPGILSNNANKFLLQGYQFVESAWRSISAIRPVSDFKTITSYRMTGNGMFQEVAPDGRIPHGKLGEESYSNQAKTYGLMLSVTRQDIINDDLGAITTVPQNLGRGAGLKLNNVFWTEFMDNSTFFTTGRANYFEGSSTNLSVDSLTTGEQKFLDMVDADGNPISAMPRILLVPTALSTLATNLYSAQEIRDTTANTKYATQNPHTNKFRPVTSRYLGLSSISGYSATAWYLLADPVESATIEVCFLNGVESPTIEESATEFDTLGMSMRGYFDFGVAKQDYRVGVKSKGAA